LRPAAASCYKGYSLTPNWALTSIRLAVMKEVEYESRAEALHMALQFHEKIGQDIILERQIKSLQGASPKP